MKIDIREIGKGIVGNSIYDFIKWAVATVLATVSSAVVGNITIDFINNSYINKYRYGVISILVLGIIYLLLNIRWKKVKTKPNLPAVDSDYTLVHRKAKFIYGEPDCQYELSVKGRSNKKGLKRYYGKYTWSGSGGADIKCRSRHYKMHYLTRKDAYIEYEIELPKACKKNRCFELELVGTMNDADKKFVPYFSTLISEPTEYLELTVCIPEKYGIEEVILEEIATVRNNNDSSEIVKLDEHGEYCWKIKSPKLFYKYSIRWEKI